MWVGASPYVRSCPSGHGVRVEDKTNENYRYDKQNAQDR